MGKRRQRRRPAKEQRNAPPVRASATTDAQVARLVYSREQAAHALGISLATLDRRVVPAVKTVKADWGARLIPVGELERYLAERRQEPQKPSPQPLRSGRTSTLPPDVVARIIHERSQGTSLREVARQLNRDGVPTGQGGRQWWPSTVRSVLLRTYHSRESQTG
jgi:hypothetical protein